MHTINVYGAKHELALFAGAGGGILGGKLLGWSTRCAVEIDAYARSILLARQRDGFLGSFPIWDDVRSFNGSAWRGHIDIISGGFPCQNISSAGDRSGLSGAKSGLWSEFARIIGEVQAPEVFIENSSYLRTNGLVRVLKDLAGMGYDARWCVLGADHAGAPHRRRRMWSLATHAHHQGQRKLSQHAEVASASQTSRTSGADAAGVGSICVRQQPGRLSGADGQSASFGGHARWWPVDVIQGVDDGLAYRLDRTRATGNGQVAAVAALAYRTLSGVAC